MGEGNPPLSFDEYQKGFADVVRLVDRPSGIQTYSLLHPFRDEQRKMGREFQTDRAGLIVQYRYCFSGKLGEMENGC